MLEVLGAHPNPTPRGVLDPETGPLHSDNRAPQVFLPMNHCGRHPRRTGTPHRGLQGNAVPLANLLEPPQGKPLRVQRRRVLKRLPHRQVAAAQCDPETVQGARATQQ